MPGRRVIYRGWIAERGRDPELPLEEGLPIDDRDIMTLEDLAEWLQTEQAGPVEPWAGTCDEDVRRAVAGALESLDEDERELIVRFYYMGQSTQLISDLSGRPHHKLESMRGRALLKLRKELATFVKARYGIESSDLPDCPICRSSHRAQIETLLAGRDRRRSWKPVITKLRDQFGLHITSPQTLIGHVKYHMTAGPAAKSRKEKPCRKNQKPH